MVGRIGLLFAALSGAGAASIVGMALRALPGAATLAAEHPNLLIVAPIPIGALVAVGHIYWLGKQRSAPVRAAAPPPSSARIRPLTPAPGAEGADGDARPPRWKPVIRN